MVDVSKKVQERRLQWYRHVMRREEEYVGRRVMNMEVDGTRGRGRPKRRWLDCIRDDLREKGLTGEVVADTAWNILLKNINPV